jgi:hypothetical protein
MYLIAMCDKRSGDILLDDQEDEMIAIFEQYAQGGFEIIESWLNEKPEDHNGDSAIISALNKHGYFKSDQNTEQTLANVAF